MATNEGYLPLETGYATRAIHSGQSPDQWNSKAVATPIFTSSTYKLDGSDFSDVSNLNIYDLAFREKKIFLSKYIASA